MYGYINYYSYTIDYITSVIVSLLYNYYYTTTIAKNTTNTTTTTTATYILLVLSSKPVNEGSVVATRHHQALMHRMPGHAADLYSSRGSMEVL